MVGLMTGCALPKHEIGLNKVLEQELGEARNGIPAYRCTVGAHRGSSVEHLENTSKALAAADASRKYAFVEFDVQYSEDNRIVVFHDRRLLRLYGSTKSVDNTTLAELEEITGGEVCTFNEALAAVDKKLNVEIKSQGDDAEDARLADHVISELRRRGRLDDVMFSSISSEVLKHIKSKYPAIPTGKIHWLTRSTYLHFDALTEGLYEDLEESGADYLMLHVSNLRNIERLLALKPADKTIVFWDFEDNMFVVHKDSGDRLWGDSAFKNWCKQMRYGFFQPPHH
jgi:glycerophosphoryl diester phosphodiesterase